MKLLVLLLASAIAGHACAEIRWGQYQDDPEEEKPIWQEGNYKLPPFPQPGNLIEFYASANTTAQYFIDKNSIGAGTDDGVVRYVLVVKTSGGATNISYEGIRCHTSEWRIYATGNADGAWAKSRQNDWRPFKPFNLQQKALARLYFCPDFNPIKTSEEGLNAIRNGSHPLVKERYDK